MNGETLLEIRVKDCQETSKGLHGMLGYSRKTRLENIGVGHLLEFRR